LGEEGLVGWSFGADQWSESEFALLSSLGGRRGKRERERKEKRKRRPKTLVGRSGYVL